MNDGLKVCFLTSINLDPQ